MKFSDDQIQQLKDVFATKDDLRKSLAPLKTGVSTLKTDVEALKKSLTPIKRKLNSIQKDLKWTMLKYDARLVHLEQHLIHPPGRADN